MMFQGKIKQLCQEIHDTLGHKKINDCFLVDVEFKNESFVIKSLKCLSNFINKDYSAKPWNRHSHFSNFIKPKENHSLSLKDHRFNRLNDCALAILYHIDDIARYLDKYTNIINGISILDRSFIEMEALKPIFAAISLVGVHILWPFHLLLLDKETTYTTLLSAIPLLHDELISVAPQDLLQLKQSFMFASKDHFEASLPHVDLQQVLMEMAQEYPTEIIQLITLLLKKFANGFEYQKGAIFGFGDTKNDDTGTVTKICKLNETEMKTLGRAQTHNLGEERSVGFVNYEIGIRGRQNLESASKKLVLNKSADLIKDSGDHYKTFRKSAMEIKEIKVKWNEKMKVLAEQGYTQKDMDNLNIERQKLDDLAFLKAQQTSGPFTDPESVQKFYGK